MKHLAMIAGVMATMNMNSADAAPLAPPVENSSRFSVNGRSLPYSTAVRVGDVLYLSGQMGFRNDGTIAEGIEGQTGQAIENIQAVLRDSGRDLTDVFHCTVILTDMAHWPAFNRVYLQYFHDPLPARSAFAAKGLVLGGLVEIECQAFAGKASA